MPQKNAKASRLDRVLCSQTSTPGEIWDTFTDYMKSTTEFHKHRLNRGEISEKEFKETINTINKLEIKVKRLISQYLRLEKRNKFLETEYELLKTENKRLFSENETLQIEKDQYKAAVKHSVEVATRSENTYKNEIHNYKEAIQDIYYQIDNLDNFILCTNEIPGFQNLSVINELPVCYSNFEEAINHSELRIHEIDDTGNIINSEPSLHYSHLFYD
ncbi:2471_t:CDS:2 [Gigaspora margarita]|uniref:2471_t:CDS:1 n=1 Tax=Gigaspora margarita TaxID=4874 RepID=A0ABN7VJA0_GIGMA|nr:2471_t:CDS:2 [Gigaspora margarita]